MHIDALPETARARVLRTLDTLDRAAALAGRMPLAELVERTLRAFGIDALYGESERTNLRRYLELLEDAVAGSGPVDAADLQTRLASLYAAPNTTPGAVDIMTIHKAKGLEWDVVFLPELQRKSGARGVRLLDWIEVDDRAADLSGVVLAPISPKGESAAELGCFVQAAHRQLESAEVARLLYVAATRARHTLHLYAAPELKKDGAVSHVSGTLLHAGWPGFGGTVQALASASATRRETLPAIFAAAEQEDATAPQSLARVHRVPDGFDPAAAGSGDTSLLLGRQATNVNTATAMEHVHRPSGSAASRAVGEAVHLFLRHLADRIAESDRPNPSVLLGEVAHWTRRIQAVLRSGGLDADAVRSGTETVHTALRNTLLDPNGWWLLQPHPHAAAELAMADPATGRMLRLDRSFLAGDTPGSNGSDTLWIADFKTGAPVTESMASFLQDGRERYAAQLRNYGRLHTRSEAVTRTMFALYYPLIPALDTWSADSQPVAAAKLLQQR